MCFVNRAMPINSINGKARIKKHQNQSYKLQIRPFVINSLGDGHTCICMKVVSKPSCAADMRPVSKVTSNICIT